LKGMRLGIGYASSTQFTLVLKW